VAREAGSQRLILETDSVEVAAKLRREGQDRSVHGPFVSEIKSLLLSFDESSVRAVGQQMKLLIVWRKKAARINCVRCSLGLCLIAL
jgi:hypothetical protein